MNETRELTNISRSYANYVKLKNQCAIGEVQKEKVIYAFESLCKAILDLTQMLHTNAESIAEKDEIKSLGKYIEAYF